MYAWRSMPFAMRSPVSDDGRGLKLAIKKAGYPAVQRSPVSDDGRGLKPLSSAHSYRGYSFARQ